MLMQQIFLQFQTLGCGIGCQNCQPTVGCLQCSSLNSVSGWVLTKTSPELYLTSFSQCKQCTSLYDCQKCDTTNIAKCTQCTYPVNQRALAQSDTTNPCDPASETVCQNCIYGYSIFEKDNQALCYDCNSNVAGSIISNLRCTFKMDNTDNVVLNKITACLDGYVDQLTGNCVTSCGTGKFGSVTYGLRGMINSTTCLDCDSSCFECTTVSECLSCKKGNYLSVTNTDRKTGTCRAKAGTFQTTYYVQSKKGIQTATRIDGTNRFPFYSIQHAITMAYSTGARYKSKHCSSEQFGSVFQFDVSSQTTLTSIPYLKLTEQMATQINWINIKQKYLIRAIMTSTIEKYKQINLLYSSKHICFKDLETLQQGICPDRYCHNIYIQQCTTGRLALINGFMDIQVPEVPLLALHVPVFLSVLVN
ncbi:UNKNOWN [Stylonychia lemnae]|uniref:Uncharacterized protein n=1 Tax=Stylonychia lemnae TaxID=5949 RepID=A0A078AZI6_STYLE|nr:UNKNOWN [Stylonychia lemnae]|eukprot:CDW86612.1 UNKNOWN [Stylonychia lemnae]